MTKNVWRCRCGKRAEVLTDENFGDCGCSDPVYGPEYFYMSEACADMLDEMDKDYDEQHKQLAEITRQRNAYKKALEMAEDGLMTVRAGIESLKLSAGELNGAFNARPKCEKCKAKVKLIEQMRDALNILVASAPPSGPLWHGSAEMQIAMAALSAAERAE